MNRWRAIILVSVVDQRLLLGTQEHLKAFLILQVDFDQYSSHGHQLPPFYTLQNVDHLFRNQLPTSLQDSAYHSLIELPLRTYSSSSFLSASHRHLHSAKHFPQNRNFSSSKGKESDLCRRPHLACQPFLPASKTFISDCFNTLRFHYSSETEKSPLF